jgi:hypothetical protein
VALLDSPQVEQQLLGLVWRGAKIDQARGEHDDWSNAAVGALVNVLAEVKRPYVGFGWGGLAEEEERLPAGVVLAAGEALIDEGVFVYTVHRVREDGTEWIERRPYGEVNE